METNIPYSGRNVENFRKGQSRMELRVEVSQGGGGRISVCVFVCLFEQVTARAGESEDKSLVTETSTPPLL
jgi:hypothetical protein